MSCFWEKFKIILLIICSLDIIYFLYFGIMLLLKIQGKVIISNVFTIISISAGIVNLGMLVFTLIYLKKRKL